MTNTVSASKLSKVNVPTCGIGAVKQSKASKLINFLTKKKVIQGATR